MKSFRFRTFCLPILVIAGGLQLSCSGDGPVEGEPVGCYQTSDCPYPGPCKMVYCRRRSPLSPGTCQVRLVPDGLGCNDGNACTQTDTCQFGQCVGDDPLPPQDACWDNDVDPNIPTTVYESTRFLWDGAGSVQSGLVFGTIEEDRAAVIRGQVKDRNGDPLTGVEITVRGDQTDYGSTNTLGTNAWFDMVVNGGGHLIVRYEKEGYLPVERKVLVPPQDYTVLPMVAMTPEGNLATSQFRCNVSGTWQTVQEPGGGRLTLLVPPGTSWDSCSETADYGIRLVEYTTGTDGPNAMPALLPPASAYTYAAEFRLEESDGTILSPEFSNPLIAYVDNFLHFDRGTTVPSGYYDEEVGAWVQSKTNGANPSSENGIVLKILSSGSAATFDITNDEVADDVSAIISYQERTQVASLVNSGVFSVGQEYWRVPVSHFSERDFNLPFMPPTDAKGPKVAPECDNPLNTNCTTRGSLIVCETQVLGEQIQVPGTPYALVYRSDRVPGYAGSRTLHIPLRGATVPASLKAIKTRVTIAGNAEELVHDKTDMAYDFVWNGEDVYGRKVNGAQPVTVRLGYVYDGKYTGGQNFGDPGDDVEVSADLTRQEVIFWAEWKGTLGGWDATGFGLGGWSLDVLHAYSKATHQLYLGNGTKRDAVGLGESIEPFGSSFSNPNGIAFAPDGTLFVAEGSKVTKVSPSGTASTVRDGLNNPTDVAVVPDGRVVVAEKGANRVISCNPDDSSDWYVVVDSLNQPMGVAVDTYGNLFVSDTYNSVVLRVPPGGSPSVFAGTPNQYGNTGDNEPATEAKLHYPRGLAIMPDGSVLVADFYNHRVRRIDDTGVIRAFAGGGSPPDGVGDGLKAVDAALNGPTAVVAAPDGTIYISDYSDRRVRRVSVAGRISTVAGTGETGCVVSAALAATSKINSPDGLAVHPDGSIYLASEQCNRVYRLTKSNGTIVPSEDGAEVYVFDEYGRHLRTEDAHTGSTVFEFTWDENIAGEQRITGIYDNRDARPGWVSATDIYTDPPRRIEAPTSQVTALSFVGNYLNTVTFPNTTSVHEMTYDAAGGGLLQHYWDPEDNHHSFTYDANGKLWKDVDPATTSTTPFKTLVRSSLASGSGFTVDITTPSGLTRKYGAEVFDNGSKEHKVTWPDGLYNSTIEQADESQITSFADGTQVTVQYKADTRFGMASPIPTTKLTLPDGDDLIVERSRAYTGLDPMNALDFDTMTETVRLRDDDTDSGLVYSFAVDRTAGTITMTTPENRQVRATLDSYDRPSVIGLTDATPAVQPLNLSFDNAGRLTSLIQSTRQVGLEWSTSTGYLDRIWAGTSTPTELSSVDFEPTEEGWLDWVIRNDGKKIDFSHDLNGAVSLVRRPKGAGYVDHGLDHNGVGLFSLYNGPDVSTTVASDGETHYDYDQDRRLDLVTWADNSQVDLEYYPHDTTTAGSAGKLHFLKDGLNNPLSEYGYEATTGKLRTVVSADATTNLEWNGGALESMETVWSDTPAKTVHWDLDGYLRVDSESVDGGYDVTYSYDDDGLVDSVTVASRTLDITLNPQVGWVDEVSIGNVSEIWSHDQVYGELEGVVVTQNGSVYQMGLQRDDLGRIDIKTETGQPMRDYGYDDAGWLTTDGTSSWDYDDNGNRVGGVYDDQDRLQSYNGVSYTHDAKGNRTAKGSTTYEYDTFGNLKKVNLPGNIRIEYDIDGAGRRVGRRRYVNDVLDQGQTRRYLLGEGNRVVAEFNGSGTLVSQFVYATRRHVPDLMVQGGNVYRFVTDQVGNVRMVVNVDSTTPDVVQEIRYDAWGNPEIISGGSFDQPFGFAGGIWDRETELVHFGAREYDSVTGRWLQKEPLGFGGGDTNFYLYAYGDPVNWVDPDGEVAHVVVGAIVGGGFGILTEVANAKRYGRRSSFGSIFWSGAIGAGYGAMAASSPFILTAFLGAGNAASLQIINNAARGKACADTGEGVLEAASWGFAGGALGHGIGAAVGKASKLMPPAPPKLPSPFARAVAGSITGPSKAPSVPLRVGIPRAGGVGASGMFNYGWDQVQSGRQ